MRPSLIAFILFFLFISLPAHGADTPKKLNIGFIYVSPVGGEGFSYSHDIARKSLENNPLITTAFVDNIAEGLDAEQIIEDMAHNGTDIIITASYGFVDATEKVAKLFPNRTFLHCSGDRIGPNLSSFFGRIYQARYLTGITAGLMTESNVIGYVAAYPIPEVIRGINAFALGAQSVNPQAEVRVIWTSTWYDPMIEMEAANILVNDGADILAQHQDSPRVQLAAAERDVYAIGYHSDMSHLAKEKHLVSAVWNWLPFYENVIRQVQDNTWSSGSFWYGIDSGIVDISSFGVAVPEKVRQVVLRSRAKLFDGSANVFRGPIESAEGVRKVPHGKKLSDEELLSMDWFVKGVVQIGG